MASLMAHPGLSIGAVVLAYPFIWGTIGWAPRTILLAILIAALGLWLARSVPRISSKKRAVIRWTSAILASYLGLLALLGAATMNAHDRWEQHFRESSCGIKPGMTRSQAEVLIRECGQRDGIAEVEGQYYLRPSGLARLLPFDFNMYALDVSYDKAGRVESVRAWSD